MSRRAVEGGPADGLTVGDGGQLRWIDPVRSMGFRAPASGRFAYRLDERGVYIPTQTCPECGSMLDRDGSGIAPDPCPLCGHERIRRS